MREVLSRTMETYIPLKTAIDVARIRRSCRVVEDTLKYLAEVICEGITTQEIDRLAGEYIVGRGGSPALKGYRGFPCAICASVNNVAAHGIPGSYRLGKGDVVTIDTTIELNGWHGDAAWTYIVGKASPDTERLLRAAWQANLAGLMSIEAGANLGDVGNAISRAATRLGCSVIQDYVGHGIGRDLHEEPYVPNYGERGQGLRIVPGMVFTVEPIVSLGDKKVRVLDDGWTVITNDGSLTAQFENTVAVFKDRVEVLTLSSFSLPAQVDLPPIYSL